VSCLMLVATFPRTATACTCIPLDARHVEPELKEATLVFVGRVKAIEPIAGTETGLRGRYRVILEVTRRWKGPEAPAYGVTTGPISPAGLLRALLGLLESVRGTARPAHERHRRSAGCLGVQTRGHPIPRRKGMQMNCASA
jgi:hypothetical protein